MDERLSILVTVVLKSPYTCRNGSVEGQMNVKGRTTKNRPMSFRTSYQLGGPLSREVGSSYWRQHVIYREIYCRPRWDLRAYAHITSHESSHGF